MGRFVGGGPVVGGAEQTQYSSDGFAWSVGATASTGIGRCIVYSPQLNRWVQGTDGGFLLTSTDGVTWTAQTSPFGSSDVLGVEWCSGWGLFVAVGDGGKLATSSDGITWTLQTSGFGANAIFAVAYSDTLDRAVIVGAAGWVGYSDDGTTWTSTATISGSLIRLRSAEWCAGFGGMFVIGGSRANAGIEAKLYTSTSGAGGWTTRSPGGWDEFSEILSGCWVEPHGLFVTGGDGYISTTADGVTWTNRIANPGSAESWGGIEFAPDIPILVAVKATAATVARTSTDGGLTWTGAGQSTLATAGLFCLEYGNTRRGDWRPYASLG
jgi:hypothetical protein